MIELWVLIISGDVGAMYRESIGLEFHESWHVVLQSVQGWSVITDCRLFATAIDFGDYLSSSSKNQG